MDFVTNSSSSSFIICNKNDNYESIDHNVTIGKLGETEFYNGAGKFNSFFDRLNFVAIQALTRQNYEKNHSWIDKINRIFKKHTNHKLNWKYIKEQYDKSDAYIDHQSCYYDEDGMREMMDDDVILEHFLFNKT